MGGGRIIIRPTPIIRKQLGQFKKLFNLYEQSKAATLRKNPIPQTSGSPQFLKESHGIGQTHITRRQIVLNRHFTEIISDVLANDMRKQLIDIGVSITSIETRAWDRGIRIFYTTKNQFEKNLHDDLNKISPKLRASISERQLIGIIPRIDFVYDDLAELDKKIDKVLEQAKNGLNEEPSVDVTTRTGSFELNRPNYEKTKNEEAEPESRKFTSPRDMSNMMLGLNYEGLYNDVIQKQLRGRGKSSRILSTESLATKEPIFNLPRNDPEEEEDPTTRIMRMQKFLVSQRKKSEVLSKVRRRKELLYRDQIKWDLPEEECDDE